MVCGVELKSRKICRNGQNDACIRGFNFCNVNHFFSVVAVNTVILVKARADFELFVFFVNSVFDNFRGSEIERSSFNVFDFARWNGNFVVYGEF